MVRTIRTHRRNRTAAAALVALVGTPLVLLGCKPKEEPAPPPEPAPVVQAPEPVEPEREYPDPPPPTAPTPVKFPDLQKFTVEKNKLQVYVVENHEVPLVSAQIVINAGSMDDRYLAEMTASMLGEGTKKRKKAKIDAEIEQVGASIGEFAGIHSTYVSTRVLKRDLKLALTLLADEVMNPAFPQEAIDKLKNQAKTGIKAQKGNADFLANTLFDMVAYPEGHPYGQPPQTEEEIDKITQDSLKKFHDGFYRANNAYLILSGDITVAEAEPLVKKTLGKWKAFDKLEDIPKNPLNKFDANAYKSRMPTKMVVHLVDRPGSAQSEVRVGNLALARKHPDWAKVDVAQQILGGGSTGRLFLDIREERGLTYGIYTQVSSGQAPGTFRIWTKTKTKKTGEMMSAIFEHLDQMHKTDPTEEEFRDAVTQIVGSFPLQIETPGQIAGKVRTVLTYNLDENYFKTYRDKVLGVTREEIKTVAAKYMHPVPVMVVVGKAKKVVPQIQEAFKDMGGVEIITYDLDLKRI